MKVHLKGRPRQYSFTRVTCLDSLLVEMLNCVPDYQTTLSVSEIETLRDRHSPNVIHQFLYGATLKVGDAKNEFFINCFLPDGSDALAAIEELNMLDALRKAKKHFLSMKKVCFNPVLDALSLRITRY